jgi:hypothetical protein
MDVIPSWAVFCFVTVEPLAGQSHICGVFPHGYHRILERPNRHRGIEIDETEARNGERIARENAGGELLELLKRYGDVKVGTRL